MKTTFVFVGFLLLATAVAQQHDEPHPKGVIYGIAINQDGEPAKRIGLTAEPLGVPLGAALPQTRTNDAGEYRFENIPWWGRYTVYADDENEGYSSLSTGPAGNSSPPEVELTGTPGSRIESLGSPESWFHSDLSHQSKNGWWHLRDASRIDADGKPRLAIVHDELLFKPRHLGTTGQEPSSTRHLRWVSRVGRERRKGKAHSSVLWKSAKTSCTT